MLYNPNLWVIIDLSIPVNVYTQHWSGRADRCSAFSEGECLCHESEENVRELIPGEIHESVNLKNHHNPSLVSKSQSPKDETA